MYELIKITEQNGRKAVSARELHAFLEVSKDFSSWIKMQIERCDLIQGIDYEALTQKVENENGIGYSRRIEYALSIDTAKEVSMMSQTEKGKQARRYFIECEKVARTGVQQVPGSFREALLLAAEQQRVIEEKQKLIAAQGEQIEVMSGEIIDLKKKTDYLNIILQSRGTVTVTQIAQDYGMSAKALNKVLAEMRIQRKVNGQWILYGEYITKGYVHSKTIDIVRSDGRKDTVVNTEWTQRGRLFLYEKLKAMDILPLIERNSAA